ncbi:MAG: hypothetical protein AMXMBFR53_32530 [Gemmatimonadota bacterium]
MLPREARTGVGSEAGGWLSPGGVAGNSGPAPPSVLVPLVIGVSVGRKMAGGTDLIHPGPLDHPSPMASSPLFAPEWHPRVRDDVVFRRVAEDWILFDPASQRIHLLDLTGALVWSFCTGDVDVPALERQVREAFGIAVEEPKVGEALQGFLDAGLLQAP